MGGAGVNRDPRNRRGIDIDTGGRVYKLMAETEPEADEWLDLLRRSHEIAGGSKGITYQARQRARAAGRPC